MNVDPVASMRCWAVEVRVGERTFDVPALPAADWFPVLTSADPGRILDFVVSNPQDPSNLDDLLLAGQIDPAELQAALIDVIEEITGRSFHASFVLAVVAETQWAAINGRLAQRGFRWDVMPIAAALDAIYSIVVASMEKDPLDKFLTLLDNDSLTTGKKRASDKVISEFESLAGPKPTGGQKATGEPSAGSRPRTPRQPQQPRQDDPSPAPTPPPGPPARSGRRASSGPRVAVAAPASDTEPRPPRPARSQPRSQSAASEAEPAPPT